MRPVTLTLLGIKDPQVAAALAEIQRASQDTLQNDNSSSGSALATVTTFPQAQDLLNQGVMSTFVAGVSLNALGDTAIPVPAMRGVRYWPWQLTVRNSGSVASLTLAQFGLFSAPAGGGLAVIPGGTVLSSLTSNTDGVASNIANVAGGAASLLATIQTLYFRVTQVQSAGAAVDLTMGFRPLS